MNKIEINKEMVVSTSHISEKCAEILRTTSGESPDPMFDMVSIYDWEYGWRIFTHFDTNEDAPKTGFDELDILLKHAKSLGCKWLVLDQDGSEYDLFEKFDW